MGLLGRQRVTQEHIFIETHSLEKMILINKPICKARRETQTQRMDLWAQQGKERASEPN